MDAKKFSHRVLSRAGITVNGCHAWDIQVHDEQFFDCLYRSASEGLGDSYVQGFWDSDDLTETLGRFIAIGGRSALKGPIAHNMQTTESEQKKSLEVVDSHYESKNGLYSNMLDPYMQYSCALWDDDTHNLQEAQIKKMRLIGQKLELQPGDHVLDIGCGWGGLPKFLSETFGCRVTGINLAEHHIDYANQRMAHNKVKVIKQDYRDLTEKYDKIYCIGVSEHFGLNNYKQFMQIVHDQLNPGGIFLLHTIGENVTRPKADTWITKNIFPNGYIPSLSLISQCAEGLFITEDVHNFNTSYEKTLLAWDANFQRNWNLIRKLHPELDTRDFYRMWRYYLNFCAGGFRKRCTQLYQIVFTRIQDRRNYKTPTYNYAQIPILNRSVAEDA
jgi:cyclopropane-fatty-acyl-phospholipid synthase